MRQKLHTLVGALALAVVSLAPSRLGAVSNEVEIQARMVDDCTTLLDQLIGPGRSRVIIRLQGEQAEIKTQTEFLTPVKSTGSAAMPGFVVSRYLEKTYDLVQRDQEQSTRTSSFAIKKIEAFIVVDERVAATKVRAVERVLSDMLRINVERGDRLEMIPVPMVPAWRSALLSAEGLRVLIALGGAMGLMVAGAVLAYLFLVRPGRRALEALARRRAESGGEAAVAAGPRGPMFPAMAAEPAEGIPRLGLGLEPAGPGSAATPLLTQRFSFLDNQRPEEVAEMLAAEPPEDLALLFAYAAQSNPTQSALLFSALPAALQARVSRALVELRLADPERLAMLENRLRTQTDFQIRGPDRLGSIISLLPPERRDALLNELSVENPQARDRVARTVFPFEALVNIKPEEFRRLLTRIPYQEWAVALKGAAPAVTERVLDQFPDGTRELMREALEAPQPKPRVLAVRARILQEALLLASEGKLSLGRGEGPMEVL